VILAGEREIHFAVCEEGEKGGKKRKKV